MSDVLLSVRGLEKRFRAGRGVPEERRWIRAVDGVSFDLRRGETLGLVGESGSGKTTIARAALRLVEPTAGTIRYDGMDVRAMDRAALRAFRRRVQMVFQDPEGSLDPRQTVGQALEEVLVAHRLAPSAGERARRVDELLDRVGLDPSRRRDHPSELSGGQRQRVAIARALAIEPELLVLDEPVSALDVSVRAQVVNLLLELQADLGLTFLFIAHDLPLVEHVSDRVLVAYLGRVVEEASSEELYRRPRHPYTRALLSAVPPDPRSVDVGRRIVLSGEVPDPGHPPTGCPFHPRCPHPSKDERCTRTLPPLELKAEGHLAACLKEAGTGGPRTPVDSVVTPSP
jgi:oligopeptide/dipeptide ABC transporter ATP-binding protein